MMELLTEKLTKDLKKAAATLGKDEARFLVDLYYQMQHYRIQSGNQIRVLTKEDAQEPHETIEFMHKNYKKQESYIKSVLEVYAQSQQIGRWLLSICGIGPVIAAGLIAHIDMSKVYTAGSLWRFGGFDPSIEWKKGEKRPFNADLKVLFWKIGQSFIKVSNNDKDIYGKLYKERLALEIEKNENGDFAEFAAEQLKKKNYRKDTEAYKAYSIGKLPKAHLTRRAARYAVKIFISHLYERWYELDRKTAPPAPFAISILGHAHKIEPPPMVD